TAWYAEYDEWGNQLNEENPHQLQQLIRLPGQQYDEESGLCKMASESIAVWHSNRS
ncbi:RHS repeat protein, partial [Escherichia coli]|nr:RHS repeat protein [Escherichia coli]